MQSKEMRTVIEFCLDHAESATIPKRVELYRGLAEFCGEPKRAAEFRKLANELEVADARCREFAFRVREAGR